MTQQVIELGTIPKGEGGDTPRSANIKVNENFSELFVALGGTGSPVVLPAALPVAKGGTGGATPAAARTGLGLKSAALADLVGTVSQAGGAVMERGTTVNGEFLKFADGTMICTKRVLGPSFETSQYLQIEWAYPMPFAAGTVPTVLVTGAASIDQLKYNRAVPGVGASSTSVTIRHFATGADAFVPGEGSSISAVAIGRWYP